jgi:hypothetical protein
MHPLSPVLEILVATVPLLATLFIHGVGMEIVQWGLLVPLFADCDRDFSQFKTPSRLEFLTGLHSEHIDYAGWPTMSTSYPDR